ncbi:MAG: hypothetical protein IPM71_06730 [Bacteroidota bacterium]|nr:MAG: hypothetical protein IPM71_06730 [Bacteroidota bacterium]
MGFVGEVMDNVKGIQLYYIAGLLMFMALFILILIRTVRIPKNQLIEYKTSVIDPEEAEPSDKIKF